MNTKILIKFLPLFLLFTIKTAMAEEKTTYLAGGCFWGMQELLRNKEGVLYTEVGYTGGSISNPSYSIVKLGESGHSEAVKVIYDDKIISFEKLLRYFFKIHDPTTPNRQGNDIGTQYRSSIFIQNEEEKIVAKNVIQDLEQKGVWKSKISTTLEEFKSFTKAEEYHQDYLQKTPKGYTCHFVREINTD